jgi:hypothetical protein
MSYSEEFEEDEEVQIDLQKFEKSEKNEEDDFEKQIEIAESIYNKLQSYIDFHKLNLLNNPSHECISNLIDLSK